MIDIEEVERAFDFFARVAVVDLLRRDTGECGLGDEELGGVVLWLRAAAGGGGWVQSLGCGFGNAVCLDYG